MILKFIRTLFFFFFLFSLVVTNQYYFEERSIQEDGEEIIYNLTESETLSRISKSDDFPGYQELSEQINDTYFTNKILEGLSDYVKDLKIVRIENASHWIKIDAPEVVVSSIKEFIG